VLRGCEENQEWAIAISIKAIQRSNIIYLGMLQEDMSRETAKTDGSEDDQ